MVKWAHNKIGDVKTAMKEFTITQNDAGQRLDRFLAKAVPLLPASLAQKYIRLKRVKLNGKRAERDTRIRFVKGEATMDAGSSSGTSAGRSQREPKPPSCAMWASRFSFFA